MSRRIIGLRSAGGKGGGRDADIATHKISLQELHNYVDLLVMGENETCSWDDDKRELNRTKHFYDFSDLREVFDSRFAFTREDVRYPYGEQRYNMLVDFRGRIINVTFNPRGGKYHLISVRPASREERKVYHAQQANASRS